MHGHACAHSGAAAVRHALAPEFWPAGMQKLQNAMQPGLQYYEAKGLHAGASLPGAGPRGASVTPECIEVSAVLAPLSKSYTFVDTTFEAHPEINRGTREMWDYAHERKDRPVQLNAFCAWFRERGERFDRSFGYWSDIVASKKSVEFPSIAALRKTSLKTLQQRRPRGC